MKYSFGSLLLFGLTSSLMASSVTYQRAASYNTLDAGNDNNGLIVSNTATSGNLGATTAQERHIAVRERAGQDTIVYIGRGGTSTGDGRTGGVIGIAAIKLADLAPGRNPAALTTGSNYQDTGLITKSGTNFSFVTALFYEPVTDTVWCLDGSGNAAVCYAFPGGTVGGNTGSVAATNALALTAKFTCSATVAGTPRGLAVRVDDLGDADAGNDVVRIAVAASNHIELYESTTGVNGTFTRLCESAAASTWTGAPAGTLQGIAFDSNGDIWVGAPGDANALRLYRFASTVSGSNTATPESFILVNNSSATHGAPSWAPKQVAANADLTNISDIVAYRDPVLNKDCFFVSTRGTDGNNLRHGVIRIAKTKDIAPYAVTDFQILDGFGTVTLPTNATRDLASPMRDADAASLASRGTGLVNQPSGAGNNLNNLALPLSNSKTLAIASKNLYVNLAGRDSSKGQTTRTSGVHKIAFADPSYTSVKSAALGAVSFTESRISGSVDPKVSMNVNALTGSGFLTAVYYDQTNPPNLTNALKGYWSLGADTGITAIDTNITFSYDDTRCVGVGVENSLQVMKSTDNGATWNPVPTTLDTANNTATVSSQTGFSLWALQATVVPVGLSAFSAE